MLEDAHDTKGVLDILEKLAAVGSLQYIEIIGENSLHMSSDHKKATWRGINLQWLKRLRNQNGAFVGLFPLPYLEMCIAM